MLSRAWRLQHGLAAAAAKRPTRRIMLLLGVLATRGALTKKLKLRARDHDPTRGDEGMGTPNEERLSVELSTALS